MNSDELKLLTSYLPFNLNIDDAAFRRQLITSVHTVLTRLRDSSLLLLRRTTSAERSTVDVSEAFGQWDTCGIVLPYGTQCVYGWMNIVGVVLLLCAVPASLKLLQLLLSDIFVNLKI